MWAGLHDSSGTDVYFGNGCFWGAQKALQALYIASISASLTAYLLRGDGRAGTQNGRLGEAVILSTGTPIPARPYLRNGHAVGDADIE